MSDDVFRWVITAGVALSFLFIVIMSIAVTVLVSKVSKFLPKVHDLADRAKPIIDTTRRLVDENAPKFSDIATRAKEIASNAKDITEVAKDQAHRWAAVGRDVADRTRAQVARVDAALDETVDQVQHAGTNLKSAAMRPVREASGVIAGVGIYSKKWKQRGSSKNSG
jgi:methyl-accepting chemotaxis protein